MSPQPASRAVHIGHRLVTVLLWFTIAFGVFALVSVGVGLARDGDSLLYGDTMWVPVELRPDDVGPLPSEMRTSGWLDVRLEVKDPTTKQMLLRSAQDLTLVAIAIAVLWQLQGFARSVVDGAPFGALNVRRLRRIGFLLVVGGPIVALVNGALRTGLLDDLPPVRGAPHLGVAGFSLPVGAMLGGLGAFILAEVFAYGTRLREDVEATV
jgi:hypothetical protein